MRILYFGAGWPTNIGNAFIDLGALTILRTAFPDAQIGFASEMPKWFFFHSNPNSMPRRDWRLGRWHLSVRQMNRASSYGYPNNAVDIAAHTMCDLVVFSGMAMCEEFVSVNGDSLLALQERGVPTILLGTGASYYIEAERQAYTRFLKQLKPKGFISRDDDSFDLYSELVPNSFRGIDCAFFVPEAYKPFPLDLPPFIVANFDTSREPKLDSKGRMIIRSHHSCWGPLPHTDVAVTNTLVSDIPHDYLTLYAQAEEVHSDRVHACIAALAFDRRARLYHPTPRGSLFAAVGANHIRDEITSLNQSLLRARKAEQVANLQKIVKDL